jgi:hypothetical protein
MMPSRLFGGQSCTMPLNLRKVGQDSGDPAVDQSSPERHTHLGTDARFTRSDGLIGAVRDGSCTVLLAWI